MKKILIFVLLLVMALSLAACGKKPTEGLDFSNDTLDGNYAVTSIGNAANMFGKDVKDLVIPSSYGGKKVTAIEASAFKDCVNLESVTIPATITRIEVGAFEGCVKLKTISVDAGNKTYGSIDGNLYTKDGSTLLIYAPGKSEGTFNVPAHVTTIGTAAFEGIRTLDTINFGNTLYYISANAFSGCTSLREINIPDSVTYIGNNAFFNCANATAIRLGKGVKDISFGAFERCSKVEQLVIGSTAINDFKIDNRIFSYVGSTGTGVNVSIGATVDSLPAYLFASSDDSAPKIQTITFEKFNDKSERTIGEFAFLHCDSIPEVYTDSIEDWTNIVFKNEYSNPIALNAKLYADNKLVASVAPNNQEEPVYTFPATITKINDYAFYDYDYDCFVNVDLGTSIQSIGKSAFSSCDNLQKITIGNKVVAIDDLAFSNCPSLSEINYNAIKINDMDKAHNIFGNSASASGGLTINIGKDVKRISNHIFHFTKDGYTAPAIQKLSFADAANDITIGQYAFADSNFKTGLEIANDNVTFVIEDSAFRASSIPSLKFGNTVTSTGTYAFAESTIAAKIDFGNSLANIADYAFYKSTINLTPNKNGVNELVIDGVVLTIGKYAFAECKGLEMVTLGNTVTTIDEYAFSKAFKLNDVVIGTNVSAINSYAFYACPELEEVTMGSCVSVVGSYAFSECKNLTVADLGKVVEVINERAFNECVKLLNVTIGDKVTEIGKYAFYNCDSLSNIAIGNSVKTIGDNAFEDCDAFTSISIGNSVTYLGTSAFYNCKNLVSLSIGDSLNNISESAFENCIKLTNVTLGVQTEEVDKAAFKGCASINKVVFPHSVKTIGESAFENCTGIIAITFGNILETIDTAAFKGCSSLKELTLTNHVSVLNESAFENCTSLKSMTIGEDLESIGKAAFKGCTALTTLKLGVDNPYTSLNKIEESAFENCSSLQALVIPHTVEKIYTKAFLACTSLKSVDFNTADGTDGTISGVTYIGSEAFKNCTSITDLVIANSVLSIDENAFKGCTAMTSLTLGESVSALSAGAFSDCTALTSVYFNAVAALNLEKDNTVFVSAGTKGNGITVVIGEKVQYVPSYLFSPSGTAPKVKELRFAKESVCKHIGEYAFKGCTSLQSIMLGENLKTIGKFAFANCNALTTILLNSTNLSAFDAPKSDNTNGVFSGSGAGTGITVKIASNVQWIPDNMFYSSTTGTELPKIKSVVFEDKSRCVTIGNYAFYNASKLTAVHLPELLTTVGNSAFYGCTALTEITIGKSVESLGNSAFKNCTGVQIINFNAIKMNDLYLYDSNNSNNSKYISENVFYGVGTSSTKGFTLSVGAEVTVIPTGLFYINTDEYVPKLTSIEFAEDSTCKTIGAYAFSKCSTLAEVKFGSNTSLTQIGWNAFEKCCVTKVYISDVSAWISTEFENNYSNPLSNTEIKTVNNNKVYILKGADLYLNDKALTDLDIPTDKTTVSNYAFYGCNNLESIVFHADMTSIGDSAFYGCVGLKSIAFNATAMDDFDNSNKVFYDAGSKSGGIAVTVGSNVTVIPDYLFYVYYVTAPNKTPTNYPRVTSVTFENYTVCNTIGLCAFKYCLDLASVEFGENSSLKTIGMEAFYSCTALKTADFGNYSNLETVGVSAFAECGKLTTVILGDNSKLKTISENAFLNCKILMELNIGNNTYLKTIDDTAFKNCLNISKVYFTDIAAWLTFGFTFDNSPLTKSNATVDFFLNGKLMTDLIIPDSVTEIGQYTLYNCNSIMNLTIHADVESIGKAAFYNCLELSTIEFNATAMKDFNYENEVFYNAGKSTNGIDVTFGKDVTKIPKDLFYIKSSSNTDYSPKIATVVIADENECVTIGANAFKSCSALKTVTIGHTSKLATIENNAFDGCAALTSVTIGDNSALATIGDSAFYNCSNLKSFAIGDNDDAYLKTISAKAFYNCSALATLDLGNNSSLTTIGDNAFYNCKAIDKVFITDVSAWLKLDFANLTKSPYQNTKGVELYVNDESLTTLVIPADITEIKVNALYGCKNIETILFHNNVTSIGNNAFQYCSAIKDVTFKENSKCESIGQNVFYKCNALETVTFENNSQLETIGDAAFYGCSKLATVSFNNNASLKSVGNNAFYNCASLTKFNIYNNTELTTIGSGAFYDCKALTEVVLGQDSKLSLIDTEAFYNCSSLETLKLGDNSGLKKIGTDAFRYCSAMKEVYISDISTWLKTTFAVDEILPIHGSSNPMNSGADLYVGGKLLNVLVIPDDVTSVAKYAMYGCESLMNLTFHEDMTSVGNYAFYNCIKIEGINLNAKKMELNEDNYAFHKAGTYFYYDENNERVETEITVTIGKTVTYVPDYLFNSAPNITKVEFVDYNTEREIGISAFQNCSNIQSVDFGKLVNSIGNYSFSGCSAITSLKIPAKVTRIGTSAFNGCTAITNVKFAKNHSCETIGEKAFYNCSGITSVALGNGLATIGEKAFMNCSKLASLTVPASVKTIYASAFNKCSKMTTITFENGSICETIGDNAFASCGELTSVDFANNATLKSIGKSAFSGCAAMDKVYISNISAWLTTNFGNAAANPMNSGANLFVNGEKLSALTIPTDVTAISAYAMYGCESITSLVTNPYLNTIGNEAFKNCYYVESIVFNATVMQNLKEYNGVFYNVGTKGNGISLTVDTNVLKVPNYLFNPANDAACSPNVTSVTFKDDCVCTHIGSYAFYACNEIESITFGKKIIAISNNAFENCVAITSITLPETLTSIDASAFKGCSAITTVTFDGVSKLNTIGTSAFMNCSSLTSIVIPAPVTKISSSAFSGCIAMTNVTFKGTNVASIGDSAFEGCADLTAIDVPVNVKTIGSSAFKGCKKIATVTLPATVTSIGSNAFEGCEAINNLYASDIASWSNVVFANKLANPIYYATNFYLNNAIVAELVIPGNVPEIKNYAFVGYEGLTQLIIDPNVSSIGTSAFDGCTKLVNTFIGNDVTIIGNSAFYGCSSMKNVIFGTNIVTIGNSAFYGCSILERVVLPDSVKTIEDFAFASCSNMATLSLGSNVETIGTKAFFACSSMTALVVPESVKSIGNAAFSGCSSMTLALIGENVNAINNETFYGCSSLRTVTFNGNNIGSIGALAFKNCSALTTIAVPNSVTSIGESAFENCATLDGVTLGSGLKTIGASAFYGCVNMTELNIHDNVTNIGDNALNNCSSLKNLYIGTGVKSIPSALLYGCYSIETLTIPYIGGSYNNNYSHAETCKHALSDCGLNHDAQSPFGYIFGTTAFVNTEATEQFHYNYYTTLEGLITVVYHRYTDSTTYYIPKSLKNVTVSGVNGASKDSNSILYGAFSNCSNIVDIQLGDNIKTMEDHTFNGCSSLENFTTGNGIPTIGTEAFTGCTLTIAYDYSTTKSYSKDFIGCTSLKSVVIGNNVETIKANAFNGCAELENVTIGTALKTIEADAFKGCAVDEKSGKVVISDVAQWVAINFANAYSNPLHFAKNLYVGDTLVNDMTIPEGVTKISNYAFYNCESLHVVRIPNSLTSVGTDAFYGCDMLYKVYTDSLEKWMKITFNNIDANPLYYANNLYVGGKLLTHIALRDIPASITAVKNYTFAGCENLLSVHIPASVTSIGKEAFKDCASLTNIYYGGTETKWNSLSNGVDTNNATVYFFSATEPTTLGNFWYYDENDVIRIWQGQVSTPNDDN